VQSTKASHGGKKPGAIYGDKKSVEPLIVATKLWSSSKVRKNDRLHKEVKVWSPYCVRNIVPCVVAKKCGAFKSGNKIGKL
jgi:hypothetical protein